MTDTRVPSLPPETQKETRPERSAALLILQIFIWLLAVIPARLVFPQIGYFGSPASLVGLLAFALWASGAVRPELLVRRVLAVRVAVVVFWLPALVSYAALHLNSVPTDEVNASDRWILFSIVWSGVALLGAEGLRSRQEAVRLLRVTVAAGGFSAAVAIGQARLNFDLTTYIAKLPLLSADGDLTSVLTRAGLNRPAGTATHPIEFGCMLAMTLGFALVLAFYDKGWALRRRWLALGLIGLAIPLAISRSAILGGLIVVFFWMVGANRDQRRTTSIALAVGAIGVFMTSPGLIGTLTGYFRNASTDSSITTRTSDYSAVAKYVRRSPFIGRGPATFLPKYRILDNTWLTFSIEVGLIGVAGLLVYYLVPAFLGRTLRRSSRDTMVRAIGQACIGLSVVIAVESTTFDFYAYPMDPGFLALLIGIGGALTALSRAEGPSTSAGARPPDGAARPIGVDPDSAPHRRGRDRGERHA